MWGICKAITAGSDPCPCLQFSKQSGEEYIVQQMSQNNPLSNSCAKSPIFHHLEIGAEGQGCRVHSAKVVFLIKS